MSLRISMQTKFVMPLTRRKRQLKQVVGSSDCGCFALPSAKFEFVSKAAQCHADLDDRHESNLFFYAVLSGAS